VDLIAGLPRQTAESWEISVEAVIASAVPHASVYMLEVDDESRLGKELIKGGPRYGATAVPRDEEMTEFYARACGAFEAAGLRQYEISNFARDGHASRHNIKYWQRAPYLGFGLDASSMVRRGSGGVRWSTPDALEGYLEGGEREVTEVDVEAGFEEALFLGLRMNVGVSLEALNAEFGQERVKAVMPAVREMVDGGVLALDGQRVTLSERGRLVSNEVFAELLGAVEARGSR
jgi:oxygen-independent coproporphyrinogen-3 oxidase